MSLRSPPSPFRHLPVTSQFVAKSSSFRPVVRFSVTNRSSDTSTDNSRK
ncbi:hypothetical protein Tco_0046728, partial [Tanacetum coccineum]